MKKVKAMYKIVQVEKEKFEIYYKYNKFSKWKKPSCYFSTLKLAVQFTSDHFLKRFKTEDRLKCSVVPMKSKENLISNGVLNYTCGMALILSRIPSNGQMLGYDNLFSIFFSLFMLIWGIIAIFRGGKMIIEAVCRE